MINTISTETIINISINSQDITKMLIDAKLLPSNTNFSDPNIYFTVPSGGDYSGMDIEIKDEDPIHIQYTTKKHD
jgi:hypothetical protein